MASDLPLSLTAPKVSPLEVVNARRMDGPEMAFAVCRSSGLHEAVVEGQIVTNRISPAWPTVPEVWKVVEDVLIDVGKNKLQFLRAQDGHRDEADVGVLRFRLVRNSEKSWIKFSVSVCKVHRMCTRMARWWWWWWR